MSKKLLLADDSITIQKVIAITFANEDYDLLVVDNGDAALTAVRTNRPDLILADVFMPGKNGYELCRAVKEDPALHGVPVLLLSGTFEPFDEAKAKAAGADGWIAKPFESQALIDRVEELLAKPAVEIPAPLPVEPPQPPVAAFEEAGQGKTEEDVFAPEAEEQISDIWEELPEAESAEPAAAPTSFDEDAFEEEDPWGEVSFDEEELAATSAPDEPEEAKSAEQPVGDEAFWDSLDEPLVTETAPAAPSAAEAEEDASVEEFTFEEEPIPSTAEEPGAPLDEGSPAETGEAAEEAFVFEEEEEPAAVSTQPLSVEEESWLADEDEEILTLDESDILEEEDLDMESEPWAPPQVAEPEPAVEAADEVFGESAAESAVAEEEAFEFEEAFAEESAPVEPEEEAVEESFAGLLTEEEPVEEEAFLAEEEAFVLEEPFAEEEPLVEEPLVEEAAVAPAEPVEPFAEEPMIEEPFVEEEASFGLSEPFTEEEPVAEAAISEPLAAVAGFEGPYVAPQQTAEPVADEAAAQAAGLSEEQLAAIVEKVAGEVIERLAGTILERIAWEVVPDLAESMIREEIRQIKELV